MSDKGIVPVAGCVLNGSNACSFGIAIGVLAFFICLSFLVKDVMIVVIDYSETIMVSPCYQYYLHVFGIADILVYRIAGTYEVLFCTQEAEFRF